MDQELLTEIRDRLRKIESYLYNDEDTGKDGIVKSFERLHRRVYELEEQKKIEKAKSATWGLIGGGVLAGLLKVIEKFL